MRPGNSRNSFHTRFALASDHCGRSSANQTRETRHGEEVFE